MGQPDQTYRHEISGGYLWSPKRNANKARNPFYESMREVSARNVNVGVFSKGKGYLSSITWRMCYACHIVSASDRLELEAAIQAIPGSKWRFN